MRDEDSSHLPFATRRRAALVETRAVYRQADAAYAPFSCPGTAECCQLAARQREPWLWPSEWELLREARGVPPARADGGCPYLDPAGARCTAYADRPFGCRTFFCHRKRGPAREPAETVADLLRRLEAVNLKLEPEAGGPRPLRELCAEARAGA